MWLFTGRYGQFGPAISAIALGGVAVAVFFIVVATRRLRRSGVSAVSVAGVVLVGAAAAVFSESQAFGEPVFVGNSLNRGAALLLAIVGVLLGASGVIVSRKRRLLGVLLLVTASAVLFGDVAGWIRRSTGPLYRAGEVRDGLKAVPYVRRSEVLRCRARPSGRAARPEAVSYSLRFASG